MICFGTILAPISQRCELLSCAPACFTLCNWSFTLLLSPPDSASPHVTTVPSRRTAANACIDEEICWTAWSLSRTETLSPPLTMWPQVTTSPSSVSAANAWPVATTSCTFLRRSWTLEVNQMELCTQKCSNNSYLYVYYCILIYTLTSKEASRNTCSNESKKCILWKSTAFLPENVPLMKEIVAISYKCSAYFVKLLFAKVLCSGFKAHNCSECATPLVAVRKCGKWQAILWEMTFKPSAFNWLKVQ